jgi:anti-sigma factor RsiW
MNQSSPHEPPTLADADLELLNAALDAELNPEQQAELQARLRSEPALDAELAALNAVRTGLRELPLTQPPRSFTLAAAPQRRLFSRLRLPPIFWLRTIAPAALVMLAALLWPAFNPAPAQLLTSLDPTEAPVALNAEPAAAPMMAAAAAPESMTAYGTETEAAELSAAAAPAESARMAPAGADAAIAPASDVVSPAAASDSVTATQQPQAAGSGLNPTILIAAAIGLAVILSGFAVMTQRRRA